MSAPASRLKKGRELSGLSVAQASKLLGLRVIDLLEYEVGVATPTPARLKEMANVYGCSRSWLEGTDTPVSDDTKQLLRDDRISFSERDTLTEILSSMESKGTDVLD
jgi:transcriptional regulator with XRE-family HTH domain